MVQNFVQLYKGSPTHSPIITLGASSDAIFYKLYKNENGKTEISEPFNSEIFSNRNLSSFITSPLFNLESSRPIYYKPNEFDFQGGNNYIYDLIHEEIKNELKKNPLQQTEIKTKIKNMISDFKKEGKL